MSALVAFVLLGAFGLAAYLLVLSLPWWLE